VYDRAGRECILFLLCEKRKRKEIYKSNGKYKQSSLKKKRSVRSAGTNPTLRDIVGCFFVFLFGLPLFHLMRNDSAG
jgi:hypothetical protein